MDSLAWPVFLQKIKEEEDNKKTKKVYSSDEVNKFLLFSDILFLLFSEVLNFYLLVPYNPQNSMLHTT